MSRLFVAIELPDAVKATLQPLAAAVPGGRPTPREQLHLTLRFLGDVDGEANRRLRTALGAIRAQPFALTPRSVGRFPPRGRPRIAWSGFEPSDDLVRLQATVEDAARGAGLAPDERPFHAHVTLARLRAGRPREVARWVEAHSRFCADPFDVERFVLFSSELRPTGAVHSVEAAHPLSVS